MSEVVNGPFAVIGVGQLGRLLGAGLLALGHEVRPIGRRTDEAARDRALGDAERVLVAVGEDDLVPVLEALPARLRVGRTWLLQNELLPPTWSMAGIVAPTVLVVWAEKKRGKPLAIVQPTLVSGPDAAHAVRALLEVDVPAHTLAEAELPSALLDKNLYILVSNFAGLAVGGTVGALSSQHRALAVELAREVLAVDAATLGTGLDPQAFLARLHASFLLDPAHACRGRSAEARLARFLARAVRLGVSTPAIAALATASAS